MRVVTLSFKRLLQAPGDASADQLDMVADLADRFSAGEARVTREQNVVLPWVHADDLFPLWKAACDADLASANVRLLTDMIACPGGDFCALANARSIPIAQAIAERFLTTSEHLADNVTSAVQLANDADPTTLADPIGEIARVDLHFPHFTDGLLR